MKAKPIKASGGCSALQSAVCLPACLVQQYLEGLPEADVERPAYGEALWCHLQHAIRGLEHEPHLGGACGNVMGGTTGCQQHGQGNNNHATAASVLQSFL